MLAVCAGIFFVIGSASAQLLSPPQPDIEYAFTLIQEKRSSEAIKFLENLTNRNPLDSQAWFLSRGRIHSKGKT